MSKYVEVVPVLFKIECTSGLDDVTFLPSCSYPGVYNKVTADQLVAEGDDLSCTGLSYRAVPVAEVVVVDFEALERDAIKEQIAVSDLQKLLPFQTEIVEGSTHFHIRNTSLYSVETKYHTIENGDTLCAHGIGCLLEPVRFVQPTCPGCIAKAKNIIVKHLQTPGTVGE